MPHITKHTIQVLAKSDAVWVEAFVTEHWGAPQIVTRGRVHNAPTLPGFYADDDGERIRLVLYHIDGAQCEIVLLNSLREGLGIGSSLVATVRSAAMDAGCTRLWLISTNDNLPALRFYQRQGFVLAALQRDALTASRRLKPDIPLTGWDGIPLRDEIELEMRL